MSFTVKALRSCFAVAFIVLLTRSANCTESQSAISINNHLPVKIDKVTVVHDKAVVVFHNINPLSVSPSYIIEGNLTWSFSVTVNGSTKFNAVDIDIRPQTNETIMFYADGSKLEFLSLKQNFRIRDVKPGVEEAIVNVKSQMFNEISVFGITNQCYKCEMVLLATLQPNTKMTLSLDTRWSFSLMIKEGSNSSCNLNKHFDEHSVYSLVVADGPNGSGMKCSLTSEYDAGNKNIPIVVMFAVFIGLALIIMALSVLTRSWSFFEEEVTEQQEQPVRRRLRSLDTFRGIAISVMIFVNYGGGGYWFFEHSIWNGLTVADLVFPWFIFIMGTSIVLSTCSLRKKNVTKKKLFLKILKRSITLVLLGLFLNNGADLTKWRIPGVLQRFGISYFVVAVVNLFLGPNEEKLVDSSSDTVIGMFDDITRYWQQWFIMLFVLVLQLLITFLLHVPGCPRGYLGPGGLSEYGRYANCVGGASGYVDRQIFGSNHMYNHPTSKAIYLSTMPYDPEGVLGCLTSIFLTFLGLQSGRIIFLFREHQSRVLRWLLWGLLLGCIALGLSGATENGGVIPINKNLWSVSFIFATGSMAFILLSVCFLLIDVFKWWSGAPFYFAGMNAILLYVGHEILHNFFPFKLIWNPSTHATLLARSTMGTLVWLFIAFVLFQKRLFWKI